MVKTRRQKRIRSTKRKGGAPPTDTMEEKTVSLRVLFLLLNEAGMMFHRPVISHQENDEDKSRDVRMTAAEEFARSLAILMIEKGFDKEEVVAAMKATGWDQTEHVIPEDDYIRGHFTWLR